MDVAPSPPEPAPVVERAWTVLHVHNHYEYAGGEDQVFEAECALLRAHGHRVATFEAHHDDLRAVGKAALARKAFWNPDAYARVRRLLQETGAEVMHVHNTLPLVSPAVYDAARAEGVAVVQTLHNYRLLCPSADLLRDGQVCHACLGKTLKWPAVVHACYRGDRLATGVVASMLAYHRLRGTYADKVDAYVVMTEFARRLFVANGFPEDRVHVKPHFVDAGPARGDRRADGHGDDRSDARGDAPGGYALFVGRLAREKGLDVLLRAWEHLGRELPLKVMGDGPLAPEVAAAAGRNPGVEALGRGTRAEVLAAMDGARVVVVPSIAYETFGLVVIEAFSRGVPVVVSDQGAVGELVDHGRTGFRFRPGDPEDLVRQVRALLALGEGVGAMRRAARAEYEAKYTSAANYPQLLGVYRRALERSARA